VVFSKVLYLLLYKADIHSLINSCSYDIGIFVKAVDSLVNQYWEQLMTRYFKNIGKDGKYESQICYLTDHHGLQSEGYWLLSSHVSVIFM
jgi:hypothetical protein